MRFLAGLPLTKRNQLLDGVKDELRGIRTIPRDAAVERIRAEIDRYATLAQWPCFRDRAKFGNAAGPFPAGTR